MLFEDLFLSSSIRFRFPSEMTYKLEGLMFCFVIYSFRASYVCLQLHEQFASRPAYGVIAYTAGFDVFDTEVSTLRF